MRKNDSLENKLESVISLLSQVNKNDIKDISSFIKMFSRSLDTFILETEQNEGLNYRAGTLSLKLLDNDSMKLISDLYFQNKDEKWIYKQTETRAMDMDVFLTQPSIDQLRLEKELKFDIEKPIRKNYES